MMYGMQSNPRLNVDHWSFQNGHSLAFVRLHRLGRPYIDDSSMLTTNRFLSASVSVILNLLVIYKRLRSSCSSFNLVEYVEIVGVLINGIIFVFLFFW